MTRPDAATVRKFNPGLFQSDEDVIAQFAVRRHELDVVLETVRDNLDSPSCQHVLVVAPRGRGKTMLLARAAAELRTNAALASRVLPVRFMEENYEIFTLADFWLETLLHLAREVGASNRKLARKLRDTHTDLSSRWRERDLADRARDPELKRELRDTRADLHLRWRERDLADHARASVVEVAELLDRKLVLMVENLQALCGAVDDDFGWGLRQALQMEPRIMLVGTATSRFAALDDPQEPFFELFRTILLEPLDTQACRRLWRAAGGGERSEREIRPLQILTGGNPRLLVIVAAFARSKSLRRLMDELVALIDDHTEYFRSHLEGMAKTERRVYLAAIDLWQPSSAAEIADRARIDIRTASAMLGRLVERGAVMAEERERKRYYCAAERLYCIYYKMRRERDDAEIVRQFVYFISVFYNEEEIRDILPLWKEEAAQSSVIREGIGRAIAESSYVRGTVLDRSWSGFAEGIGDTEGRIAAYDDVVARFGSSEAPELRHLVAKALFNKGVVQGQVGDAEAEIAAYDDVVARFGSSGTPELQEVVARALFNKGAAQGRAGDAEAEIAAYDDVVARFGSSDAPELQEQVARALFSKAIALGRAGEVEAEIAAYDDVVARFGSSDAPELQEVVAGALFSKGVAQGQVGDAEAQIAAYDDVVARFGSSNALELRVRVAKALVNKAIALGRAGEVEAEIAAYDDVVARFGDGESSELQKVVARALFSKGIAQGQAGDAEAEIAAYDDVVARFGSSDALELQEQVAKTLVNKGAALARAGDTEAGVAAYDDVVARFGSNEAPELQTAVASALFNKGIAQGLAGDAEAEIAAYDDVVARFGSSEAPELQERVVKALVSKAVAQGRAGDAETEIAAYDDVVAWFGSSESSELQEQVAEALFNKAVAQGRAGDAEAEIAAYDDVVARFGNSEAPELQEYVAKALFNKGGMLARAGDAEAGIATYDDVVARFGSSQTPELQEQVASSLFNKGVMQGQTGNAEAGIAAWDDVIARFGGSKAPELRERVARSFVSKASTQYAVGETESALSTCDETDRWLNSVADKTAPDGGWWTMAKGAAAGVRAAALIVHGRRQAAIKAFRSACAMSEPGDDLTINRLVWSAIELAAGGTSPGDMVDALARDRAKAGALAPLLVALRRRAGEAVRAPTEMLEVADDIDKKIEERKAARNAGGKPAADE